MNKAILRERNFEIKGKDSYGIIRAECSFEYNQGFAGEGDELSLVETKIYIMEERLVAGMVTEMPVDITDLFKALNNDEFEFIEKSMQEDADNWINGVMEHVKETRGLTQEEREAV